MIPRGAQLVIDARMQGGQPRDPVIVSFVGSVPWTGNVVIHADPKGVYDWRFLRDLLVQIVVKPGVEARDNLFAIFEQARLYPTLIDLEKQQAASVLCAKPLRLLPFPKHHPGWQELFAS